MNRTWNIESIECPELVDRDVEMLSILAKALVWLSRAADGSAPIT